MKLKKLIYLICFASIALVNIGCSDFLDVKVDSVQDSEEYWNAKEDVSAVLMGAYTAMRNDVPTLIQWSELRGDVMAIGPGALTNEDMLEFKNLQITEENEICKWVGSYTTILRCNTLLENASSVLLVDDTYTQEMCDMYMAEAMWLRALCYFNLVRTFRDVPFITWSYVSDDQDFCVAKTSGSSILSSVLGDLEDYYSYVPESHINTWESKGRATKGAFFALMADICLWQEDYESVIMWCDSLDGLGLHSLVSKSDWFSLYNPGNSEESIFELQWSSTYSQTNSFYTLFCYLDSDDSPYQTYAISTSGMAAFTEYSAVSDVRGAGGTYVSSSDTRVWKYGFQENGTSERSTYDQNWIFYRYADMILMRAEALIMTGEYSEAYSLILSIRTRAGYGTSQVTSQPSTESAALELLFDERMREFAFEGKRWFDLVRWASIKDYTYKDNLVQLLLENVTASQRPLFETRLEDVNGFYLPIYKDDITASGGALVQNTYYL